MALVSFPSLVTLFYLIILVFPYSCAWVMSFLFDIMSHSCDWLLCLHDSYVLLLYYLVSHRPSL